MSAPSPSVGALDMNLPVNNEAATSAEKEHFFTMSAAEKEAYAQQLSVLEAEVLDLTTQVRCCFNCWFCLELTILLLCGLSLLRKA